MKDWKQWFRDFVSFSGTEYSASWDSYSTSDVKTDDIYEAFIARMIDEGYVVANPKKWVRPDIEEVTCYFVSKIGGDVGVIKAEEFYNHWDSLDWMVRKTRIKSWKGRAATWIKNNENYKNNRKPNQLDDESTSWGAKL